VHPARGAAVRVAERRGSSWRRRAPTLGLWYSSVQQRIQRHWRRLVRGTGAASLWSQ
jgi:hypothetical protein